MRRTSDREPRIPSAEASAEEIQQRKFLKGHRTGAMVTEKPPPKEEVGQSMETDDKILRDENRRRTESLVRPPSSEQLAGAKQRLKPITPRTATKSAKLEESAIAAEKRMGRVEFVARDRLDISEDPLSDVLSQANRILTDTMLSRKQESALERAKIVASEGAVLENSVHDAMEITQPDDLSEDQRLTLNSAQRKLAATRDELVSEFKEAENPKDPRPLAHLVKSVNPFSDYRRQVAKYDSEKKESEKIYNDLNSSINQIMQFHTRNENQIAGDEPYLPATLLSGGGSVQYENLGSVSGTSVGIRKNELNNNYKIHYRDSKGQMGLKEVDEATARKLIYDIEKFSAKRSVVDQPIFSGERGLPQDSDIKQGQFGDCYLLTTLGAGAANPISQQYLKDGIKDHGDYVEVRFYIESGGKTRETWIPVSKIDHGQETSGEFQPGLANNAQGPLWPMLYEKGFALLNGGSFASISADNVGWVHIEKSQIPAGRTAVQAVESIAANINKGRTIQTRMGATVDPAYSLFGNRQYIENLPSALPGVASKEIREAKTASLFDDLRALVPSITGGNKNKLVFACTFNFDSWESVPEQNVAGLASNHAYQLVGVEEDGGGEKWVRLRNPWGRYVVQYKGDKMVPAENIHGMPPGEFNLKLKDFEKYFSQLRISGFDVLGAEKKPKD